MSDAEEAAVAAAAASNGNDVTHEWSAFLDDEGRVYYYNSETEESSWEPPADGKFNPPDEEDHKNEPELQDGDDAVGDMEETADTENAASMNTEGDNKERTEREHFSSSPPVENLPMSPPADNLPKSPPADTIPTSIPMEHRPTSPATPAPTSSLEVAAGTADEDNTVAAEWLAYLDDEGREYFYNAKTGETQWERPEGATVVATDKAEAATDDVQPANVGTAPALSTDQPLKTEEATETEPMKTEEPEPEPVDPAVARLEAAQAALAAPDSVLEPHVMRHVTEVVSQQNNNPQLAIQALIDSFVGQTALCGLLARWWVDLKTAVDANGVASSHPENALSTKAASERIRDMATNVIRKLAQERFSKDRGDAILDLSKSEALFLQHMMDSPRWRPLLMDLTEQHKDSAVLMYCLRAISKRGFHREIAARINQSEHFAVFSSMLHSELQVLGRLAVSHGSEAASVLETLVPELQRACTATSFTYVYSMEVLRELQMVAEAAPRPATHGGRFVRATRVWERLAQTFEAAMVDPPSLSSALSPILRKRRLEVALTASELYLRQRKRPYQPADNVATVENGGSGNTNGHASLKSKLESALSNFMRRYAMGIAVDDNVLSALLPDSTTFRETNALDTIGQLLLEHPAAIQALLGHMYKPSRAGSASVKTKCARLVALATMAANQAAYKEMQVPYPAEPEHDELALTRIISQGAQLCEQLEIMVSFLVSVGSDPGKGGSAALATSPGQKLCQLAFHHAVVAQGVILWARDFTANAEFAASPSFPTMSVSILGLVRLLAQKQPMVRYEAINVAFSFFKHSNVEDLSYKKVGAIKEQSLRLLIFLMIEGESGAVLGRMARWLGAQQGASGLDASVMRYFLDGVARVIKPPMSRVFVSALVNMLKAPQCIEAMRSRYVNEDLRNRFDDFLSATAKQISEDESFADGDKSAFNSILESYQIDIT